MLNFQYKLPPFKHQKEVFERTWEQEYFGLLMEQRTGKSAVILYTAAQLHKAGRINGLLLVCPNGVHRNWLADEVVKHLPDWTQRIAVVWSSNHTKAKTAELESLFNGGHELRILAMNIEALATKKGVEFARRFLNATTAMMVVDESTRIKSETAAATKACLKLAPYAKYRRILNGTPITHSPFDIYHQLLFLHEDAVPVASYVAFKARYAELADGNNWLVKSIIKKQLIKRGQGALLAKLETGEMDYDHPMLKRFAPRDIVATDAEGNKKYRNLEELQAWLDKCCYRVTRKECADLPEKLYKRWEVELTPHQDKTIKHYVNAMKKGETPEPINKMVAVMLLQRMVCGIIPKQLTGDEAHTKMFDLPEDNPRIQAVQEIIEAYPDASIIFWARFKTDLHEIVAHIQKVTGKLVARYWGDISSDEREEAKLAFQEKRVQYFVGQQGAGGVGLPLHAADVMCYFSNSFSLYERLQSEDRAENMQKKTGTLIIDIEAKGTVDTKIINALRSKKDIADLITGDESNGWLE